MENSAQPFRIPHFVPFNQRVPFCLSVIGKLREEVAPLRKKEMLCQRYHDPLLEELKVWRAKYQIEKQEKEEVLKENAKLKKEKEKLKQELEKITKTNNRYRASLFDHGNFKNPDNGKKSKGGQNGHADTNPDSRRNYSLFNRKRLYVSTCGNCGRKLSRANSFKEKILLDIKINTEILQLIIESERQWCGNCQVEIRVVHPESLPFTEYGINTFMVVMYMRYKGKQSVRTIASSLNSLFGLPISKSGVGTLLTAAKEYLGEKYETLKRAIRESEVMYNDETGWSVRGQSACMWIMATADKDHADGTVEAGLTVYVAAESKGKGIFEEMYKGSSATSMHDGNPSYESVTGKGKTAYCWSHVLRFCFEETDDFPKEHPACAIRDRLLTLYQTVRKHPEWGWKQKEKVLRAELDSILKVESDDQTVNNIKNRIETQKEGLILALLITPDGTNNLAEREFRGLAISRNISYGSDTYGGMETTAILASVVQTISRDRTKPFLPTLRSFLQEGLKKKYPRYKHAPVFDT